MVGESMDARAIASSGRRARAHPTGQSYFIPIHGSEEAVQINSVDMPDDAGDLLEILKAEIAPLPVWLQFAAEYYMQGQDEQFINILRAGSGPDISEVYTEAHHKSEQIAILDTLAAYYVKSAQNEKNKEKKDTLFKEATDLYNKSGKLSSDNSEVSTWIGKGIMLFVQGDYKRSQFHLEQVLVTDPTNTPATICMASILFNQRKFHESLEMFRKALRDNPTCPADVRLGLAFCYHELKDLPKSKEAFQRVLDMDAENDTALVGLAVLAINDSSNVSGGSEKLIQDAMRLLQKAYGINKSNPMLLNHLANHFFYKQDYNKVTMLATTAFNVAQHDRMKSESCYHIARAYHAQDDFANAYKYYEKAVNLAPDFALAQFGLGQMCMYKGDNDKAFSCLQKVDKLSPDCQDVMKILGFLYSRGNDKAKAAEILSRVTLANPDDVDTWIAQAELLRDPEAALNAYEKAIKVMKEKKSKISSEIYNNVGALYIKLGKFSRAENSFKKALAANNSSESQFKACDVTTIYNLGRLHEKTHKFPEAEAIYKAIIKEHPNYVDAILRLGCIARDSGKLDDAVTLFNSALGIKPNDPDAFTLLATVDEMRGKFSDATKKHDTILKINREESYSILAIGNFYYRTYATDKKENPKNLQKAFDCYSRVLGMEPNNLYAANGVAICFAEMGQLDKAKEVFSQVRESTKDVADLWVNLAHVNCMQQQFVQGLSLYGNCAKKFGKENDPNLMHFLAYAYLEFGKMEECKSYLNKAIELNPDDDTLHYNLAVAKKEHASRVLKVDEAKTAEIELALTDLDDAIATFRRLGEADPQKVAKHAVELNNACTVLKANGTEKLEVAQEKARELQAVWDATRSVADSVFTQKEEAKKLKLEEEKKKAEEEQALAVQKEEELAEKMVQWREEVDLSRARSESSSKKKRSKKVEGIVSDDSSGEDLEATENGDRDELRAERKEEKRRAREARESSKSDKAAEKERKKEERDRKKAERQAKKEEREAKKAAKPKREKKEKKAKKPRLSKQEKNEQFRLARLTGEDMNMQDAAVEDNEAEESEEGEEEEKEDDEDEQSGGDDSDEESGSDEESEQPSKRRKRLRGKDGDDKKKKNDDDDADDDDDELADDMDEGGDPSAGGDTPKKKSKRRRVNDSDSDEE